MRKGIGTEGAKIERGEGREGRCWVLGCRCGKGTWGRWEGGGGCGKRGEKIPTLLSINWRQGPVVVAVGSSGGHNQKSVLRLRKE